MLDNTTVPVLLLWALAVEHAIQDVGEDIVKPSTK